MSILGTTLVDINAPSYYDMIANGISSLNPMPWLRAQRDDALRSLLADHTWKMQPDTWTSKIKWVALNALSIGRNRVDDFQDVLPHLPVPSLNDTLDRYLASVKSLLTDEEYQNTSKLVEEFRGGRGQVLHQRLLNLAAQEDNWIDRIWLREAYLKNRAPLPLSSDYYGLDSTEPRTAQYDDAATERLPRILMGTLRYLERIRTKEQPPTLVRGIPLCMAPVSQLAGTHRVPGIDIDTMSYNPDARHIMVFCKERPFRLEVIDEHGELIRETELRRAFADIRKQATEEGIRVGVLSGQDRAQWAWDRDLLIASGNKETLEAIEGALLVLCLDDKEAPNLQRLAEVLFTEHRNRWFGPLLQFVSAGGLFGGHFEHTGVDATIVAEMQNAAYDAEPYDGEELLAPREGVAVPEELKWSLNPKILDRITEADSTLAHRLGKIDLCINPFNDFGKSALKPLNISPDSFIQMAVQWAHWRLHGEQVFTYETASTRMFLKGRTETIRTASPESLSLVKALSDSNAETETKRDLLRQAIRHHKQNSSDAYLGQGCDRHLLALRVLAGDEKIGLFEDKAYKLPFKLATSQTPCPNSAGGCFLPLTEDGYGVSYHVEDDHVTFHITSLRSCETTDSRDFARTLSECLRDLRALLV